MQSFKKKIFVSFIVPLALFLTITIPIANGSVDHIVFRSMNNRADELIEKLCIAKNKEELAKLIKAEKYQHFYRIGVFDNKQNLVYDTHTKHLLGPFFYSMKYSAQPEVEQAAIEGTGYAESYSGILQRKLVYLAKQFDFHGKSYILRLAFPHEYIEELKNNFETGFFIFSSAVLILFSITVGLMLSFFSKPIKTIVEAIQPYQQGKASHIAKISLKTGPNDIWTHLANTINSLSEKIERHIATLTTERNEKTSVLEALSEGVLAVDASMKISYANSMAISLLDLAVEKNNSFFPKDQHSHCFRLLQKAAKENSLINDTITIEKPRTTYHLNVIASSRGKEKGALLVLQDKSTHYRVLEMRKMFIANASHELKTPITIIQGYAETLRDHTEISLKTKNESLDRVVTTCERMTKIISDLLTLADVENLPQSRIETFDIVELLHASKKKAQELQPRAHIDCVAKPNTPLSMHGDKDLIESALSNLLVNAVKYCDTDPMITITLEKTQTDMLITVTDNGIGIPEEDIENIFQRFYTVDKAKSKKLGGSGLGLSIVKTIVEKHFGSISVQSKLGKGTTFTLTFPHRLEEAIQKDVQL